MIPYSKILGEASYFVHMVEVDLAGGNHVLKYTFDVFANQVARCENMAILKTGDGTWLNRVV